VKNEIVTSSDPALRDCIEKWIDGPNKNTLSFLIFLFATTKNGVIFATAEEAISFTSGCRRSPLKRAGKLVW
jgi:hypothetical protein